jgi:hypothetical protein
VPADFAKQRRLAWFTTVCLLLAGVVGLANTSLHIGLRLLWPFIMIGAIIQLYRGLRKINDQEAEAEVESGT